MNSGAPDVETHPISGGRGDDLQNHFCWEMFFVADINTIYIYIFIYILPAEKYHPKGPILVKAMGGIPSQFSSGILLLVSSLEAS